MDEQQLMQMGAQIIQAAQQGDEQAAQIMQMAEQAMQDQNQMQQIMQAAQQGDQTALAVASVIMVAQSQQQAQMARHGAKLNAQFNYIKYLRGKCPEGYEMAYFKNGGKAGCKKCQNKEKRKNVKSAKEGDLISEFKCGRKMKKKAQCGTKIKKAQKGTEINMIPYGPLEKVVEAPIDTLGPGSAYNPNTIPPNIINRETLPPHRLRKSFPYGIKNMQEGAANGEILTSQSNDDLLKKMREERMRKMFEKRVLRYYPNYWKIK